MKKKYIDWNSISKEYDYFVFGSDQIWNTRFQLIRENIEFYLGHDINSSKKISYAASFGTDEVEPEYKYIIQEELRKFQAISVREMAGKKIIRDLLSKDDVSVVLDPTLLLTKEKWVSVSKKPVNFRKEEKYLLSYFLGNKSENISEYLKSMSRKYDARVIDLEIEFKTDNMINDRKIFTYNPSEFVWLISHAQCIITDSYHATVFSIIFNKGFVVFPRISTESNNDTNSRLFSLLKTFGKLDNYMGNKTEFPDIITDNIVSQDLLKKYRQDSLSFLSNSIAQ